VPKRIKSSDRFICIVCNRLFSERGEALQCEESHNIIYIPFERADLKRLLAIIKTGNFDYMTEHLLGTLLQYDRLNL